MFVGGFSLAAAEHAAASIGNRAVDALGGLAALIDASLVRQEPGPVGTSRYFMLETVREFGQERLAELDELRMTRDAHAAYVVGLGEWLDPNRRVRERRFDDRLHDIEVEYPNVRAALDHMAATGEWPGVLRLAGAFATFWHHRGFLREGRQWLEWAIEKSDDSPTVPRARALAGLSLILLSQGDPDAASPPAQIALAIACETGEQQLEALAIHLLGLIEISRFNWREAATLMEEALGLWREIDMPSNEAMAMMSLSLAKYGLGDTAQGSRHAEASIALFRSLGYASGTAFALVNLARISVDKGEDRPALLACQEAVRLWAGVGERWAIANALARLADMAARYGQLETAATLIGAIDVRMEESGASVFPVDRGAYVRATATSQATLGEPRFTELRSTGRALATPDVVSIASTIVIPESHHPHPSIAGLDALTPREREVLRHVVEGHSNAEIADALYIGIRTVRAHVASILARLDLPTRTAAATYAVRHGID